MGLWERLDLDMARHRAVALVGGGGKTTNMYALAREARDRGRTVIVTTATHILPHPSLFLTGEGDSAALRALLGRYGIVTVGTLDRREKMTGGDVAACLAAADTVLIEADGARLRPLKVPAAHEPVIPPQADAVVAVAGADCLGGEIAAVCHRPEEVCRLLDKPPEARVGPADVAAILGSPQGGRKGVGEAMAFRCILNKADTPALQALAAQAAEALEEQGIHTVLTSYTEEEQGGLCWF